MDKINLSPTTKAIMLGMTGSLIANVIWYFVLKKMANDAKTTTAGRFSVKSPLI